MYGARGVLLFAAVFSILLLISSHSVEAYCTGDPCDNADYKTDLHNGGDGNCDMLVNYYTQGTTYNNEAPTGSKYKDDYCISSTVLREYYLDCCGIGCADVTLYIDYTCPSGYSCSNGACISNDPCVNLNCDQYDGWYCDPGQVQEYRDYYCTGTACAHTDSSRYDCDNYDNYWCDSGNVRKLTDGSCSLGSCITSDSTVEDCDDSDTGWTEYCSGSCVYRGREDYYCSSGSCTYNSITEQMSCNGDSGYCTDKANYCSGCSRGEYDCDFNSHCAGSLVCLGPIGGSLDGCCNPGEFWVNYNCVECNQDSHCPSDYCDPWYYECVGSQVIRSRTCVDYYCSGNSCTHNSWPETEVVASLGDSNYCSEKDNYCGGCTYGEWDCDFNGECASSAPDCVDSGGGICTPGAECGCCATGEVWDTTNNICKRADGQSCTSDVQCQSSHCVHGICRPSDPYCGDAFCDSGEDHNSCFNDCIPPLGHADYCKWKHAYGSGCGYQEYDCDEFATYDECDTSAGLDCKGPLGGNLDGCCYSHEDWAWNENRCCDISVGAPFCSSVSNDAMEPFGTVDGSGNCMAGSRTADNCAADEVCSGGACHDAIYYTLHFEVHYSVEGVDAVPLDDDNGFEDASSYANPTVQQRAPDYVENVAAYFEYAYDVYKNQFGYNLSDNIKITIEDWDAWGKAWHSSSITIANDIYLHNETERQYALKQTTAHELFHTVQMRHMGTVSLYLSALLNDGWLVEGTAQWSEDTVWDTLDENNLGIRYGVLNTPFENLLSREYSAVLYWKYFERLGSRSDSDKSDEISAVGSDMMIELFDSLRWYTSGKSDVEKILQNHGTNWDDFFTDFIITNAVYRLDFDGLGKYDYEEDADYCEGTCFPNRERPVFIRGILRLNTTLAKSWLNRNVDKWASDYFMVMDNKNNASDIRISFNGEDGKDMAFIILYIKDKNGGDGAGNLEIEKASMGANNVYSVTKQLDNYELIFAIVAGMSDDGIYDVSLNAWCSDRDGDGYNASTCGGPDCNDGNASIRPGVAEVCDFVDNDCDGIVDEGCTLACYVASDCGSDGLVGNPYCQSDDVWDYFRVHTCNLPGTFGSYCTHSDTAQAVTDCGVDGCDPYSPNYCSGDNVVRDRVCHDRGCSGGACYDYQYPEFDIVQGCAYTSCGPWSSPYCMNDDLYITRDCLYGYCSNAACQDGFYFEEIPTQDCGVSGYGPWGASYCKGNDVYHNRTFHDRGCAFSSCYDNVTSTEESLVQTCQNGCSAGSCMQCDGDVDNDLDIDIFDLAAVGLAFGSVPGDSNWNPDCDTTVDGKVDIFDLAMVGINFGNTC
jgi:hypothetical protein